MKIGFDFGSKNISYAVLDNGEIVEKATINHNGNVTGIFSNIIDALYQKYQQKNIETLGISGSIDLHNYKVIDPVLASVEANKFLKTGCQNILSIGCETFYLIILDENFNYIEHTVNSDCASGTGSFIDQQAERLGFSTEQLAQKARDFTGSVPSIATRCAVFAKSDIIHAQAQGFNKDSIAAGICEGVARNVLSNVIKGRKLSGNLLMIGGVSQNEKIITQIRQAIDTEIKIAESSTYFNAIGAALLGTKENLNIDDVLNRMQKERELRDKLSISLTQYPDFDADENFVENDVEVTLYQPLNDIQYQV
ncbi:MAG: hypothetical protein MJB14_17855, partial [Spirochaetes bacterium]|nr:hypothetical protein [Spirochaetota bacterium]